ncbi:MAG TPA: caspase family protein, partial [Chitinophagaceae bacterium]|nr:caspase family protein [Chitinophagaceae bacterium]
MQFAVAYTQNTATAVFNQQLSPSAHTYAVIVGISKYETTGITQLEYADKDARVFASYLESKAGGSVPADNIRLLLNENATFAAIYDAMNWLMETCQKDDVVYFYFSGHGDMENNTIYKLGFLLSYNTPRTNYINNAVRLEDLNNMANTLSVARKAKVVLITDACHSGNLAGNDFRGNFLVGD